MLLKSYSAQETPTTKNYVTPNVTGASLSMHRAQHHLCACWVRTPEQATGWLGHAGFVPATLPREPEQNNSVLQKQGPALLADSQCIPQRAMFIQGSLPQRRA